MYFFHENFKDNDEIINKKRKEGPSRKNCIHFFRQIKYHTKTKYDYFIPCCGTNGLDAWTKKIDINNN